VWWTDATHLLPSAAPRVDRPEPHDEMAVNSDSVDVLSNSTDRRLTRDDWTACKQCNARASATLRNDNTTRMHHITSYHIISQHHKVFVLWLRCRSTVAVLPSCIILCEAVVTEQLPDVSTRISKLADAATNSSCKYVGNN